MMGMSERVKISHLVAKKVYFCIKVEFMLPCGAATEDNRIPFKNKNPNSVRKSLRTGPKRHPFASIFDLNSG